MAMSKDKFKKLANKLIYKTSGDINVTATFVYNNGANNRTKTLSLSQEVVEKAVFTTFDNNEFSADDLGQLKVDVGDMKLIVYKEDLTKDPRNSTHVIVEGVRYSVVNVSNPAKADAVYILRLRK